MEVHVYVAVRRRRGQRRGVNLVVEVKVNLVAVALELATDSRANQRSVF
jgi:hypothetical protein